MREDGGERRRGRERRGRQKIGKERLFFLKCRVTWKEPNPRVLFGSFLPLGFNQKMCLSTVA